MRLRTAIAKVSIGNTFVYQAGDGFLQAVSVTQGEQDRASVCQVSIHDPNLRVLNLFLTQFQAVGGIRVPKGLLASEQSGSGTGSGGSGGGVSARSAEEYIKGLEQKYGKSDLTGLTARGKEALSALNITNVRAYLDAVAIAELGKTAAANGGYGILYGDQGGVETFKASELTTHPKRRRTANGLTSSATGRYQVLDRTWDTYQAGLGLIDFKPVSQEIFAVGLLMVREVLQDVIAGNIERTLDKIRFEWASIAGNPYGQGTEEGRASNFLANFNQQKARYVRQDVNTESEQSTDTGIPEVDLEGLPGASAGKIKTIDVSQGTRIIVELGFNDSPTLTAYEYLLTGIQGNNNYPNTTQITGKHLRSVIAGGSKKFTIRRNISIRQLTKDLVNRVGGSAEIAETAGTNEIIGTIAQQESDYALLVKLARQRGLFVRSEATKVIIDPLKETDTKIKITHEHLMPGSNWSDNAADNRILSEKKKKTTSTLPAADSIVITDREALGATVGAVASVDPTLGALAGVGAALLPEGTASRIAITIQEDINKATENLKQNQQTNQQGAEETTSAADDAGLPSVADEIQQLAEKSKGEGGILDLSKKADTQAGIGKGFPATLNVNTLAIPDILKTKPGYILSLEHPLYGSAISREYRIDYLQHGYQRGAIATTISVYLPVRQKTTSSSSPSSGTEEGKPADVREFPEELQAHPETGDPVAGYTVTTAFGERRDFTSTAVTRGVVLNTPAGIDLYSISKGDEVIKVVGVQEGGRLSAYFDSPTGWRFRIYPLNEISAGEHQNGVAIAKTAGSLVFEMSKTGEDLPKVNPYLGYLQWILRGEMPKKPESQ